MNLKDICRTALATQGLLNSFKKHRKNRKTLPREHLIGRQGVKMFLLKVEKRIVIIQVLSQLEFLSLVKI